MSLSEVEQDRLDILTGRDEIKRSAPTVELGLCPHCRSQGEICFVLSRPYAACLNPECNAQTGLAETVEGAAAKWNRRDD